MALSVAGFARILLMTIGVSGALVAQATATLEPMRERELGGVEARTGVNLHFSSVVIENQGGRMRFTPDRLNTPDNFIELGAMGGDTRYDGRLSIEAKKYASPQRHWYVKDTAKFRKGAAGMLGLGIDWYYEHERTEEYKVDKGRFYVTPAELRGVDAVVLTMDNGPAPFSVQNSTMALGFSAEGNFTDGMGEVNPIQEGMLAVDTGTLSISGVKNMGQQVTIYPISTIDNYVSGVGVALEIRSKTSIDDVSLTRDIGGVTFTNARFMGIHMRESFSQELHDQYWKWGGMDKDYFASDAPSEYFDSTYDPDGYFEDAFNGGHEMLPLSLVREPYSGGPDYYNMYDGFMLNGNINQVDFIDRVSGKKMTLDHGQITSPDEITGDSFDDPDDLDDDYQIYNQSMADNIAIKERPMTLQVKTGRTYKSFDPATGQLENFYDDRSYIAINWPRHGSLRVEEVQGFLSKPDEWPYNHFGTSLGSMVLDGMRAKKTYIEIPGRREMYAITEQNINTSDPNNWVRHPYLYEAGKLPDEMNPNGLPAGQAEWDPVGRGQLDFLNKLGHVTETGGRWDLYSVQKVHGGQTFDFWHIYEPPYPGGQARWTPDH